MGRLKSTKEHAKEVKLLGRVVLVGTYKGARTKTDYWCSEHDQVHPALPTNILKGRGLICCKGNSKENDKRRIKAVEEYDKKLKEIGLLIRIEEYGKNSRTPILHKCLLHGRPGKSRPSDALRGKGLKCCWEAAQQKEVLRKVEKAASTFEKKLSEKNKNLLWVRGEYLSAKSTLWFYCKKHKEEHPSIPNTVLKGHGLRCCHRANSSEVGKKISTKSENQIDTVWRALSSTLLREGRTMLYLFASPFEPYKKFGISFNPQKRKREGGYGESLIKPRIYEEREDAILLEQAFKFSFSCMPPDELQNWGGKTELTILSPREFENEIIQLEIALKVMGRWKFAKQFCNPYEVKLAKEVLGINH